MKTARIPRVSWMQISAHSKRERAEPIDSNIIALSFLCTIPKRFQPKAID